MPHDADVLLMIGELSGTLKAHIEQVKHDREERSHDREHADQYRKDVRHQLRNLEMGMAALPNVVKRVETIETTVAVLNAMSKGDSEEIAKDFEFVRRWRAAFDTMKSEGLKTATRWLVLAALGALVIGFKDTLLSYFQGLHK